MARENAPRGRRRPGLGTTSARQATRPRRACQQALRWRSAGARPSSPDAASRPSPRHAAARQARRPVAALAARARAREARLQVFLSRRGLAARKGRRTGAPRRVSTPPRLAIPTPWPATVAVAVAAVAALAAAAAEEATKMAEATNKAATAADTEAAAMAAAAAAGPPVVAGAAAVAAAAGRQRQAVTPTGLMACSMSVTCTATPRCVCAKTTPAAARLRHLAARRVNSPRARAFWRYGHARGAHPRQGFALERPCSLCERRCGTNNRSCTCATRCAIAARVLHRTFPPRGCAFGVAHCALRVDVLTSLSAPPAAGCARLWLHPRRCPHAWSVQRVGRRLRARMEPCGCGHTGRVQLRSSHGR